ncbi:unnamed protein product [Trichobilharzia regenti]|nr:unnamed protein product [Trichobilharzia regenti]
MPLTKSEELKNTEPTTEIKHPTLNCPDGSNSYIVGKNNNKDYFPVIVPKPKASDLVYVMPITILLLVVGVVVLLMA